MRDRWAEMLAWLSFSLGALLMGGAVLESSVYVPNWLHDMPASLEVTRTFLAVRNPGNFFQVAAPLLVLLSIAAIAVAWHRNRVRNALIGGLLLLVVAEAMTFVKVYPQIGILLGDNVARRPLPELQAAAGSFLLWGFWIRVPIMAAALFGLYSYAARTMTRERVR